MKDVFVKRKRHVLLKGAFMNTVVEVSDDGYHLEFKTGGSPILKLNAEQMAGFLEWYSKVNPPPPAPPAPEVTKDATTTEEGKEQLQSDLRQQIAPNL